MNGVNGNGNPLDPLEVLDPIEAGATGNDDLIRARIEDTALIGTKLIWNEQANNGVGDYQTVDEMDLKDLFACFDFEDTSLWVKEVTVESLNYFSAMLERRIPEQLKQGTDLEMSQYFSEMNVNVTDEMLEKFYKYKQTHFDNVALGLLPTQSHLNQELADKVYRALRALR